MTATDPQTAPGEALTHERLRELFLFTDLDDAQLDWVARTGDVVHHPAGTDVSVEGEPAECFSVLLSGTLSMTRRVGRDDVETVRTVSTSLPPTRRTMVMVPSSSTKKHSAGSPSVETSLPAGKATTSPVSATQASWAGSRSVNRNSSRSRAGSRRVGAVTGPPGTGARG